MRSNSNVILCASQPHNIETKSNNFKIITYYYSRLSRPLALSASLKSPKSWLSLVPVLLVLNLAQYGNVLALKLLPSNSSEVSVELVLTVKSLATSKIFWKNKASNSFSTLKSLGLKRPAMELLYQWKEPKTERNKMYVGFVVIVVYLEFKERFFLV